MSAPPLSPRQRRRILRAHQLRQRGATIRHIAHQLDASPSTIHNDLRTLEQHWQPILQHAARDALTAQIADLQDDIALYRSAVPQDLNQQRLQRNELAALRRELRLTAAALNGHPQTPEEEAPADYPDYELADQLAEPDRTPPNTIEHHRTESNTHNRPDQIGTPSPTAQQEKIPEQRLPATNAAAASASPANRTAKTPPAARPEQADVA